MDSEMTPIDAAEESLVTRRSKRSTAGNRMVAALAEIGMEELTQDPEDDIDFVNDKVEEDIFGSDFESTDEEAEKEAEVQGETEAVREERSSKRTARTRLERITAAAHARNRKTFNPDIQISAKPRKAKPKGAKTVRFDAEAGDSFDGSHAILHPGQQRTSKRRHTVQSTTATATRVQQSQARRAALPKKAKTEIRKLSQAELIAAALDTEEGNIIEHRDYLKNEEEKRKRARVVRTTISGPVLRWVSKTEEVKVLVPPPPPPTPPPPPVVTPIAAPPTSASPTLPALYRGLYGQPYNYTTGTTSFSASGSSFVSTFPAGSVQSTTPFSTFSGYSTQPTTSSFPVWPPPQTTHTSTFSIAAPAIGSTTSSLPVPTVDPVASTSATALPPASQPEPSAIPTPTIISQDTPEGEKPDPPALTEASESPASKDPEPEYRTETVSKNYLIHELDQQKSAPKPTWNQSMTAILGDHVKWDQVKVFVGKARPLQRPRQTCPITGTQARYMDPRTGVHYANSEAYKVLTSLLNHEYVWNPSLGCYTDHEPPPPPATGKASLGQSAKDAREAMDIDR